MMERMRRWDDGTPGMVGFLERWDGGILGIDGTVGQRPTIPASQHPKAGTAGTEARHACR